jgi:hypothetical protein
MIMIQDTDKSSTSMNTLQQPTGTQSRTQPLGGPHYKTISVNNANQSQLLKHPTKPNKIIVGSRLSDKSSATL